MTMQMLMADERWAGRVEGVLSAISSLMNTMNWSVEQAMEALCIPKDERVRYAALIQNGKEGLSN